MFDQIIRNASIYDGTGFEAFISDVAINGDKIVQIGQINETGRIEIDAGGLSLASGFIDTHTHSDVQVYSNPSRLCKLRQGITMEIGGQCGWSYGPADPGMTEQAYQYMCTVNNRGKSISIYPSYGSMLEGISRLNPGAHQLTFVGHNILRGSVIGMENRPPTNEELNRMKALLEQAMQEGAPGMSTGLVYAPGCYSTTEELVELAKVVAKYDGIYTSHIRDEADNLLDAVAEAIRIAKEADVRVNISHFKVMYQKNHPKMETAIQMIEAANSEGCNICFDAYPFDASAATILSTLPPSYLTHGIDWIIDELNSAEGVDRLEKAILTPTECWENPLLNAGFDRDMIVVAPKTPEAVGKTIHEYAVDSGLRDIEAYVQILVKNRCAVSDVRFVMDNNIIARVFKHPLCTLGTDGIYRGDKCLTHPRALSSFPRFLGRFVREQKLMTYQEAIRRITGLPADRYQLKGKGYIKEGYDADLVLFDFEHIIDHATYNNPFIPNEGISMVMVGGQAAVINDLPTGVMNGKVYKRL